MACRIRRAKLAEEEIGMRVTGTFLYEASPERLYAVFTNPEALEIATPGLRALRPVGPDRWDLEIKVGVGGFALTYHGTMAIIDRYPGKSYRIIITAQTHNGSANAEALLHFAPEEGGNTRLIYEAEVSFDGAQKLLPALARGLVAFFLHGMKEYLEQEKVSQQT